MAYAKESSDAADLMKLSPDGPATAPQHTNMFAKLINKKIDKSSTRLS